MTRGNAKATGTRIEKPAQPSVELVNPGTAGIVYDEAGHSVGGGQRVALDGDPDRVAMRQLEAGHLLAQRGDTWLTVQDGQLVDPNQAGADDPPASVPEPQGDDRTPNDE